MSLTKEQIIKYIDELFLCVRKADWNCCHPDKDYTTWNLLSYPEENSKIIQDSLKQQILYNQRIVERLKQRIDEVQEFVDGCEEAKNMPNSMMSPIAGLMEKSELEELKKILGEDNLGKQ